jgi:hypothetical protein
VTEGNPLLTRLREREGIFGSLHRRNLWIITAAALFHGGVAVSLLTLGWDAVLVVFALFSLLIVALASVAAVGTVSHQVKIARVRGTWDELLITMLSDRDLVNGLLMLALRPTIQLLWLTSPSYVACVMAAGVVLVREEGLGVGLLLTAGFLLLAACLIVVVVALVLCMAVMALNASLKQVGAAGRLVLSAIGVIPLILASFLGIYLFQLFTNTTHVLGMLFVFGSIDLAPCGLCVLLPLCLLVPAMCWYEYRVLCCTLRQRLLGEGESG